MPERPRTVSKYQGVSRRLSGGSCNLWGWTGHTVHREAPLGVEKWFIAEVGAGYPLVWEHASITSPSPCYFPGGRYSVV